MPFCGIVLTVLEVYQQEVLKRVVAQHESERPDPYITTGIPAGMEGSAFVGPVEA
jgi:hypothetical protein